MDDECCVGQGQQSIAGESFPVWFKQSKNRSYCARVVDKLVIFHQGKSYFSHFFLEFEAVSKSKRASNSKELTPSCLCSLKGSTMQSRSGAWRNEAGRLRRNW